MPYVSPHRPPHEAFPQPEDPTVRVWRYLDLPRFIWLLSTGALAFARVDTLEDPFEGSIPPVVYEAWKSRNAELIAGVRRGWRKQAFVSCWHANNAESEAMWRLYCGAHEGIALQTTYEKLGPYAEEWYRDVVISVMERFAPDLVDRLTWSRMRGVPLY